MRIKKIADHFQFLPKMHFAQLITLHLNFSNTLHLTNEHIISPIIQLIPNHNNQKPQLSKA